MSFYQTSLVSKDLLYRKKNKFSYGIKQEITSWQDRFMLAKLGSQSERRFRFILPASHEQCFIKQNGQEKQGHDHTR